MSKEKPIPPPLRRPEVPYLHLNQIGKGYLKNNTPHGRLYPMYAWEELTRPQQLDVFRRRYPKDDVFKPGYAKGKD